MTIKLGRGQDAAKTKMEHGRLRMAGAIVAADVPSAVEGGILPHGNGATVFPGLYKF
jgi:hypothetical protein